MRLLPFTPAASRCAMSHLGMQPKPRSRSDLNPSTLAALAREGRRLLFPERVSLQHRPHDTDQVVRGGLTLAQLYSTASYQTYDLAGINLRGNYLGGGNFAHQSMC
jgi:hypothetical protein